MLRSPFASNAHRHINIFTFLMLCAPLLAAAKPEAAAGGFDWLVIISSMLVGLVIFLFGMETMSDALRIIAGNKLKNLLSKLTTNRIMGMISGAFVTAAVQSSSVTTVLIVGFVTAGLMTLPQAIGVILGADIGTTITAQIIAFNVTKYAAFLMAIGYLMHFIAGRDRMRHVGMMMFGFGLLFFGMGEMKDAMHPLRESETFLGLMARMDNPLLAVLVSTVFTSLIQSSAATIGIVIVMAAQGVLSLEAGIVLTLGANIGTCATAGLAALGKPRPAQRAALAHVMFKIIGVAIILPFVPQLAALVDWLTPGGGNGVDEITQRAKEVPRQIANAHTIFNVGVAFAFLPLSTFFAAVLYKILPDRAVAEEKVIKPKYLDPQLLRTPGLAFGMVRREVNRMAEVVEEMISGLPQAVFHGDMKRMEELRKLDDSVDTLHSAITVYLSDIGEKNISGSTSDEVLAAMRASSEIESIGDIVETNMWHLADEISKQPEIIDADSLKILAEYHGEVLAAFRSAVTAYVCDDLAAAQHVQEQKDMISEHHHAARLRLADRMRTNPDAAQMVNHYTVHMNIMDNLKRIFYHSKRIVKSVIEQHKAE
ncbi:Na/Pi cotransporter family protein [Candidatus Sumerlaeota bacterium]|nr:Na/Pi cotransporter family protein [Candidatus Sumerlaeota bacterium]